MQVMRGDNAPMSGNDLVIVIDQNGIVEAESLDAARDLRDLLRRVLAGVARIWSQRVGGPIFKVHAELDERCIPGSLEHHLLDEGGGYRSP